MKSKSKKRIVWEWLASLALIPMAMALEESSHLAHAGRRWSWAAHGSSWAVIVVAFLAVWRRWRHAEIELIRRTQPSLGHAPRVALLAGHDLLCGTVVVVNDRGLVVEPDERPYPPPANPAWVAGIVDEDDIHEDDDVPPAGGYGRDERD